MSELCWQDECAVMAVSLPHGTGTAPRLCYDGLRQQQHRGQDGSGMALQNRTRMLSQRKLGLVAEVYSNGWLRHNFDVAIGHNRYATQGSPSLVNLQPHRAVTVRGEPLSLASNGDLTNFRQLRRQLKRNGVQFVSTNDGELLAWLVADGITETGSIVGALRRLRGTVTGAYSAVVLFRERVYVARDPLGFRPLVITALPDGGIAVASETVAFDILHADATQYGRVAAGAILELINGKVVVHDAGWPDTTPCKFEHVYFSRPDSVVFGLPSSLVRRRIGWALGRESHIRRRSRVIVVPVPDSANWIAQGVAESLGVPYEPGAIIRSHTARRTFIEKEQRIRDEGVRYKLNPDRSMLEGMTVLLVDDSIVRGTTVPKIVRMLRRVGVAAVHLLIGSPPIRFPCFMGIATPRREELIANRMSQAALTRFAEADSLTHLSLAALQASGGPWTAWERRRFPEVLALYDRAAPGTLRAKVRKRLASAEPGRYCYACFTGDYPVPIPRSTR